MASLTPAQANLILATTPPAAIAPASAPGASKTGIPAQKVVAGGISGVLAWVLLATLAHFGFDLQPLANSLLGANAPDVQATLAGIIALAIANWVPPSQRDIINHLTDEVVHAAQRDPDSQVSAVLAPTAPAPGDAPVIAQPPSKGS